MPITEGGTTAPVDSAGTAMGALYDETNLFLFRRTRGKGWWVGARTTTITSNFSRPADTTAYAAGDAITNSTSAPSVITFSNMAVQNGASGLIVAALLIIGTNQATDLVADLILTDTTFTATNDNAAFAMTDGESQTVIGVVNFNTPTDIGANNIVYFVPGLNIPYQCGASSTSIFGGLIARNAYTPASADTFHVRLLVQQD